MIFILFIFKIYIINIAMLKGVSMLFYIVWKGLITIDKDHQSPDKIEIEKQDIEITTNGITSNISSGFNYLNLFELSNDIDQLPSTSDGYTRFRSVANENFVDTRPATDRTSIFPLSVQEPRQLSRYHLVPGYIDSTDCPGEKRFLSKVRDQMLGNIAKSHPFNERSDENDQRLKQIGFDIEKFPLLWTPVSKNRTSFNSAIKESDRSRFIFHCPSFTSDHDDMRTAFKSSSNNGVNFWFKDSSNNPSAIRTLILSEFIRKYSRFATIADPNKWYSFTAYPFQKAISSELQKKILELISNKIIVVDHIRINLTSSTESKNCPILGHYLKNGWKLSKDDSALNIIFKDIDSKLSQGMMDVDGMKDNGFYTEDYYKQTEYLNGDQGPIRKLKSVHLTKTTFINVADVGLNDMDGVYVPNLDIVIGKMKVKDSSGEVMYPVDYIHHPNSKEGTMINNSDDGIEIIYVDNSSTKRRPLYVNTHGLIHRIYPEKNHNFKDGIYVIKKRGGRIEDSVEIEEELRVRFGIFTTIEDAKTYTQVNKDLIADVDNMYKHMLHDAKVVNAIELEKMKAENVKNQFERNMTLEEVNYQIKRLEQETKIKELVGKAQLLEREINKHLMTSVPGTMSASIKNILELGGNIVKTIQTLK